MLRYNNTFFLSSFIQCQPPKIRKTNRSNNGIPIKGLPYFARYTAPVRTHNMRRINKKYLNSTLSFFHIVTPLSSIKPPSYVWCEPWASIRLLRHIRKYFDKEAPLGIAQIFRSPDIFPGGVEFSQHKVSYRQVKIEERI